MKILITGANGMVGKNLQENTEIHTKYELLVPTRNELNLNSYAETLDFISEKKPDFIIHAAGKVGGIQANLKDPVGFLVENLDIGRNLIMAANACKVTRLLNLGSSCIYPREAVNPLTEDLLLTGKLEPTNEGYALAKIVALKLCQYINLEQSDRIYKTVLPCNLYGRHDKFDPAHSHLVPAILHKLHEAKTTNAATVEIWGDGSARREFLYAGDLADFISYSIDRYDAMPELLNVGLGFDFSVKEYYEAAKTVVGYEGDFTFDLTKPVGMRQKLLSVTQTTKFGWTPKVDLLTGLKKTYQYYLSSRSQKEGSK